MARRGKKRPLALAFKSQQDKMTSPKNKKALENFTELCFKEFSSMCPDVEVPIELIRRQCRERWRGLEQEDIKGFYDSASRVENERMQYEFGHSKNV